MCETFRLRVDPFGPDSLSGDPMRWTRCHDAVTGLPVYAEPSRSWQPPDRVIAALEELCRCRCLATDLGRTPLPRQRKGRFVQRYFRIFGDVQQTAGISLGTSPEPSDGREGGE
ncbi:MAG: hypothetical protein FJ125_13565 [Deltaproteobacteria bacterium]|nr:hypothetical protein [Deltaproteobacteria bacterium]